LARSASTSAVASARVARILCCSTPCIVILVTIYAALQPVCKKVKALTETKEHDGVSPVIDQDMLYKDQGMYFDFVGGHVFILRDTSTHGPIHHTTFHYHSTAVVWYRPSYISILPMVNALTKYWNSFDLSNLSGGLRTRIPDFSSDSFSLPPHGSHDETSITYARIYTVIHAPENGQAAFFCGGASEKVDPTLAKRFALSSGDTFLVPPCNPTRFENNSSDSYCVVASTMIYVISYEDATARLAEISGLWI